MTRLQKITFNILLLVLQLNLFTCKPCIRTLSNTYSSYYGNRDRRLCSNLNDAYRNPYYSWNDLNPFGEPCGNVNCSPYDSASNCIRCSYDPTCNLYGNPRCFCEPCNNPYMNPVYSEYNNFPQPVFDDNPPPSNRPPIIIINDDDNDDRCLTDDILGLLLTSLFNNDNNGFLPPPPNPSGCGCCNCNNNNNCNCGNRCNNGNDNNCNSGNKCSTTVQITIVLPKSDNATKPSITLS